MCLETLLVAEIVDKLLARGSTLIARQPSSVPPHIVGPFLAAPSDLPLIENICKRPVSLL